MVLVSLDEPQGRRRQSRPADGGWTAAPVVAAIIDRIGPILGVPPTPPRSRERMRARLATFQPKTIGAILRQEASIAAWQRLSDDAPAPDRSGDTEIRGLGADSRAVQAG